MYILKNALRCIVRSKGRNILIGIIALVIAISACIGLSIRQAAENAKQTALDELSVSATIQYDRASAMGDMGGFRPRSSGGGGGFPGGSFDPSQLGDIMGKGSSLTLEEYQKYADAESVQDFYYSLTAYFDGSENLLPVSDETDETEDSDGELEGSLDSENMPQLPNGVGGKDFIRGASGDFSIVGYNKDEANRRVLKLSGGQQQRVAIARALSYDPDIILADEPTGNLDRETQKEIMDIFRELADQGKCVILVSHSPEVAEMCDERYELVKLSRQKKRM